MLVYFIRSIILYLLLILVIRLMGKRQIGEMGPTELVVTMLIADLASIPMQDLREPLWAGIIPIFTILALELLFSMIAYYFTDARNLLNGKPVILMQNGTIIHKAIRKNRITTDDLLENLRDKGITDLSQIQFAILETNGKISILLKKENQPVTAMDMNLSVAEQELPVTIVTNGALISDNLKLVGKDEAWLNGTLQAYGTSISNVLLMTVTEMGNIYISLKE